MPEPPTADEFFGSTSALPTADQFFGAPEAAERNRYRQINEGTIAPSPLKDFLFSDNGPVGTVFHSAGRIVRAFGQGLNEAGPATGLSDETKDTLKRWTGFDKWSDTHKKIAKAASNVLLEPTAYDASLVAGALSGVQRGAQAAVAQLGEETGHPQLGREIAAIPEAFPTFEFRMGMPSRAVAEAERARALGVIGPDGEAGWKGTAPAPSEDVAKPAERPEARAEEHPEPIPEPVSPAEAKAQQETAAAAVGREPEAAPAEAPSGRSIEEQRQFIAGDVARQLERAGRPKDEAEAAGAIDAENYITLASLFKGRLGTAEEIYAREGQEILGPGARTSQILPPKPPRPVNEATLSLLQFLAHKGGLKRTADLEAILDKNPTVGRFGKLFRDEGMSVDRAREAASEAGYLAENVERTGQQATVKDLLEAIHNEARGRKVYRQGMERASEEAERFAPEEEAPEALEPEETEAAQPERSGLMTAEDEREAELLQRQRPTEHPALAGIPGLHIGPGFLSPNELYQITAYHGSPHDFDRFDISKIGTGEGAQAYGHGLYFAENEGVAKQYRDQLAPPPDLTSVQDLADQYLTATGSRNAAIKELQKGAKANAGTDYGRDHEQAIDLIKSGWTSPTQSPGRMYQVAINADPEHFLDFDKPLNEQSQYVQDIVKEIGFSPPRPNYPVQTMLDDLATQKGAGYGSGVGENIMREAGIPGIKYLDQGSRLPTSELEHNVKNAEAILEQVKAGKYWEPISVQEAERNLTDARSKLEENKTTHNYVVFDEKLIDITHKDGTPVSKADRDDIVKELFQPARGAIKLNPQNIPGRDFLGVEDVKPILRLTREANASTAIHELGHKYLAQLMRYAEHELAPDQLKADAQATLKWLGVDKAEDIARKHHEKFATGFEQYLREGTAPSPGLARVFAQFRQWLLNIYQSIKGLGQPINEDIRGVFDRLLAEHPQRTEAPPTIGEQRLADVEAAAPEAAAPLRESIEREAHTHATENLLPEEQNERHSNVAAQDREPPSHGPEPPAPPNEARVRGAENPASAGTGEVGPSGGEGAPEGIGAPAGAGKGAGVKTEPPAEANASFEGPKSPLIDKAGNIRLDKLDTPEDVTQVIRDTAANNDEFWAERRGKLADHETLALADALGMDPAWLDRKRIGDAFNVEEIRAARRLLVQSATAVRDAMIAAKDGAVEDLIAFGEAMRRHEMIQAKVSQATAEAGRALRAFRENIPGQENIGLIDTFLKENTGRTLFQLKEMARYGANLKKPAQVSRFVFDTANGKIKQAIVFYYVNALISGPITHLRYAAGNALTALYTPLVKIPIAATIGAGRNLVGLGDAERVYLGEAGAQLYGLLKGSREGLSAALEGWRTGNTPHLPGEEAPNMFEAQPMMPPIPGTIGRILGLPGKSVGAIHGFFSALRYEQEVHGMAYRTAAQEGLSGQAFVNRVAELVDRPTQEMMEKASATARRDLYMAPSDYQSLEAKLARISNHNVATKVILPFVKIGTQITARAFEGTPLAPFQKQVRENLSGKNGAAARDMQLATIAGGTALMATMSGMVLEGMATGDGPSDPEQRQVWLLNHHPNSIQIGDISVTYARLGALAMLLRTAANATESARGWGEDQGHMIAGDFLYGFEKAVLEEGFLTGVKDMIDAIYHHEEYGQRYVAQMLTNWLPWSIGFGQVARQIDPYQRETRANSFIDALWKDIEAKTPWGSEALFPRRDMFGEPIPQAGPVQNYANDPVVERMNDLHIKVGRLQRKVRGIPLTDEQYDDYARVAGRTTKMMLDNLVRPGFEMLPNGMQVELIHKMITEGRKVGENAVIMQSIGSDNDVMKQAMEHKVEKINGKPETVH